MIKKILFNGSVMDQRNKPTKQQLFNEEQKKLLKNRKVVQLNKFIKGDVSAFSVNDLKIFKLIISKVDSKDSLFKDFYEGDPFTKISDKPIDLKQVVNSNKCLIHLEHDGAKLVVHAAIDNLLKGASGQAIQNMNLMYGLEETTGLKLKANYF